MAYSDSSWGENTVWAAAGAVFTGAWFCGSPKAAIHPPCGCESELREILELRDRLWFWQLVAAGLGLVLLAAWACHSGWWCLCPLLWRRGPPRRRRQDSLEEAPQYTREPRQLRALTDREPLTRHALKNLDDDGATSASSSDARVAAARARARAIQE
jgi:hypothetical protein